MRQLLQYDVRPDPQRRTASGIEFGRLEGGQNAGLQQGIDPDRLEPRQIACQPSHSPAHSRICWAVANPRRSNVATSAAGGCSAMESFRGRHCGCHGWLVHPLLPTGQTSSGTRLAINEWTRHGGIFAAEGLPCNRENRLARPVNVPAVPLGFRCIDTKLPGKHQRGNRGTGQLDHGRGNRIGRRLLRAALALSRRPSAVLDFLRRSCGCPSTTASASSVSLGNDCVKTVSVARLASAAGICS